MKTALCRFEGGGSLDGAVRHVPAGVRSVVTTVRDGTSSCYVLADDSTDEFQFTGFGQEEIMSMKGARRQRREMAEQAAQALRSIECSSCGRVHEGEAAHAIHSEHGVCLSAGAHGQLVQLRDGRWGLRWRHPEIR